MQGELRNDEIYHSVSGITIHCTINGAIRPSNPFECNSLTYKPLPLNILQTKIFSECLLSRF